MKQILRILLATALIAVCIVTKAAPPSTMNYQGNLADASGIPIDGTVSMTFRLYNVETGGLSLWEETQNVTISQGYFSVELGSITSLNEAEFTNALFLGVTAGTDSEMTPRRSLSLSGYAIRAKQADNVPAGSIVTLTGGETTLYTRHSFCSQAEPNIELNETCQTAPCSTASCPPFLSCIYNYYRCDGSCPEIQTPDTCSNTSLGVLVQP